MHPSRSTDDISKGVLDRLPSDVLRKIILFLDITCITALSQLCVPRFGNISEIASDDHNWFRLTNNRFNIFSSKLRKDLGHNLKPSIYGANNWKDVYRSLNNTNRIPYRRKNIFGKGGAYLNRASKSNMEPRNKRNCDQICAMWIMLNHTEDCNLRRMLHSDDTSEKNSFRVRNSGDVFVETQIALQNVKSGFVIVDVDVYSMTFKMLSNKKCAKSYWIQRIIQCGKQRPKVIYRSIGQEADSRHTEAAGLSLRPFEFVIISVSLSLTNYADNGEIIQFETDFLSRAVSICVPISCHLGCDENILKTKCVATMIPEEDIWKNYMELPGNVVTLVDKSHLV